MIIPIYELKYNKSRMPCLKKIKTIKYQDKQIETSDVISIFEKAFDISNLMEEVSVMLCFDSSYNPIGLFKIQKGTPYTVNMVPATIIKRIMLANASSFILAHNHPSGNLTPSQADITSTILLKSISIQLLCNLNDHFIIANGKYISLLDVLEHDKEYDYEYVPSALEITEQLLEKAYQDAGYRKEN